MANLRFIKSLLFIPLMVICASISFAQASQTPGESADKAIPQNAPVPAVKAATEAPVTSPNVVCDGNQLTISANNSTLGSVLEGVHNCTGVKIDIPIEAGASRVFEKLGPGSARDVLTSLLSETGFDFVIGSSDSNPDKVETVLLMARGADTAGAVRADMPMTPARRAYMLMHPNTSRSDAAPTDYVPPAATSVPDTTPKDDSAPAPAENPAASANPTPPSDQAPAAVDASPASSQRQIPTSSATESSAPSPGSTSDQITNMEKMFQQRMQMNRNQNPQPPQ